VTCKYQIAMAEWRPLLATWREIVKLDAHWCKPFSRIRGHLRGNGNGHGETVSFDGDVDGDGGAVFAAASLISNRKDVGAK
jgi:hypothetical protein